MAHRTSLLLLVFVSFLLGSDFSRASSAEGALRSYSEVGLAFESLGFNGVAMVTQGDRVLWEAAYGQKDLQDSTQGPLKTETQFPIGSITKQFASAMILRFQEKGLLSIDESLLRFFPDYPHAAKITLRHLMGHTSGIPNYTADPAFWPYVESHPDASLQDLFAFFWNKALDFEPNSKHSYSNSGYILLGAILEKLSGKDFGQLLQDEILMPLGMKDSFYRSDYDYVGEAQPHQFDRDYKNLRLPAMPLNWAHAAGGIVSTLEDMRLWNRALDLGTYISKESVAMLANPLEVPEADGYGLGLITSRFKEHELVWHTGGLPGFIAYSVRIPSKELSFTVFTNTMDSHLRNQMMNALISVSLEGVADAPPRIPDLELDPEVLRERVGDYFSEELGMSAEVRLEGKRLYMAIVNPDGSRQPDLYMMPTNEKVFSLYSIAKLEFGSAASGQPQLRLLQSGREFVFLKK